MRDRQREREREREREKTEKDRDRERERERERDETSISLCADTITSGACQVQARIKDLPGGEPDAVKATKYTFTGCAAATAMVASVGVETFTTLNCAHDSLDDTSQRSGVAQQFGVCAPWNVLSNLVDDPDTPFDETSAGTYLPE